MGKRSFLAIAAGFCVLTCATASKAAITDTLTSPAIYGSGNSNILFTVERIGTLELALRAHTRYPTPDDTAAGVKSQGINGSGIGVYGSFLAQGFNAPGTGPGPRGSWNFDFSINSDTAGTPNGPPFINNYTYTLGIDTDPSSGITFQNVNPVSFYLDNEFGDNVSPVNLAIGPGNEGAYNVMQNSRNMAFDVLGYNAFTPGIYDIRLSAFEVTGASVGSVGIRVIVGDVPEPMSFMVWSLLGMTCTGLVLRRRGR